jgi:Na+/melibiose symporter-like transporter
VAVDTAAGDDRSLRAGRRVPYVLLIPGMLFTFVFFIVP